MEKSVCMLLFLTVAVNCASINMKEDVALINADASPQQQNKTQFQYKYPITNDEILQQDKSFWLNAGQNILKRVLQSEEESQRYKIAKNVIIFVGDGMGISTITAARIYKGQQKFGTSGEEYDLTFDKFPNSALVKTYNVDMQVPDSAGTATALFTGVKTRYEAVGLDVNCNRTIVDKDVYERSKVDSIMVWAQNANKDTDIARQLVEDTPGKKFKVILGGGQQHLGHTMDYTDYCTRQDGLNLTNTWTESHAGSNYILATNNEQLNMVNDETEYLLGPTGTPSLTDMTRKALHILKKGENGFVLMVEGGLIDRAHHKNYARLAMEETAEFDKAISLAINETGPETLIIVTADHSHTFTMEGYSKRGNDILGFTEKAGEPERPFLTLAYANGPGFNYHYTPTNTSNATFPWRDSSIDENRLNDPYYQHIGAFNTKDETHGGEDVAVFAKGPNSNLIRGVIEQNYIALLISYSGCFGPQADLNPACHKVAPSGTSTSLVNISGIILLPLLINFI
ncbi:hypothetical protein NQ314_014271 [Rhamnusium bicolor]|uniref:Alkaline phosphatase n=1 Tax=Rhamnusium bicolor TaxID=1586634 RepID=A0AAV8X3E2_9CUCU|nr:hypothetical protein NQ314_014271 [Rhamnusium bicolor]